MSNALLDNNASGALGEARAAFSSILFGGSDRPAAAPVGVAPAFFHDLNLDQIVQDVVAHSQEYDLAGFFYTPLRDPDAIAYRQEVMRDLEHAPVIRAVQSFAERMGTMRRRLALAEELDYRYEKGRWFLGAVLSYCDAVHGLLQDLRALDLAARGLRAFRAWLAEYAGSSEFSALRTDAQQVASGLAAVAYALVLKDNSVTVRRYDSEADLSAAVERTFEKFRRGAARDYRIGFPDHAGLNHIEAQILDRVALLHPGEFQALDTFCVSHGSYRDATIMRFDREIQFYVAYLDHLQKLERGGLRFCYPEVTQTTKEVSASDAFDLALAARLAEQRLPVVANDFFLRGPERVFVVSGPNQGGKTTFARMFGQLHYLASLGCPVPGTKARLFLCDELFTHFEREEEIESLRGKLQDDLIRIRHILERATPDSILILNEVFASTTVRDAIYLSRQMMSMITKLGVLAVWVTFLTELSSFDEKTVSVVGTVDSRDPAIRTYKLERRQADGLAYAQAIARKYRLTYESLSERLRP